jgi:hypothetical protein
MQMVFFYYVHKKTLARKNLYKGCYIADIISLKKTYCAGVSFTLRETNFSLIRADLPERSRR